MSYSNTRAALETALYAINPVLATAWENVPFTPVPGIPFQRAYLITAQPDNSEYGPNFIEQGLLHINLAYPQSTGPADIDARFELIRDTFKKGNSFSAGDSVVTIAKTPWIDSAFNDGTYFCRPVKIQFFTNLQ